jgi:dienelactone hydrolase
MDAYGALAALRALPYVDGKHIGIMGGSRGGWATLTAMYKPADAGNPLGEAKRDSFTAAIALYPGCEFATPDRHGLYTPLAPVLILIGDKDDWTPAEPCRQLAEASRAAGFPVEIKVYPGAYHSFDSDHPVRYDERRNNLSSPSGHGATTGGDPAAWADARKQVAEFFARYLKPQR